MRRRPFATAIRANPYSTETWVAATAVGELQCDEAIIHRGQVMLSLLRERARIAVVSWDWTYREDGLGD